MAKTQTSYFLAMVNLDTKVAKIRAFTPVNREKFKKELTESKNPEVLKVFKLKGNTTNEAFANLVENTGLELTKEVSRDTTPAPVCVEYTFDN